MKNQKMIVRKQNLMKILAKIKKCSTLQLDLKLMQKQPPKGVLRKRCSENTQ